MSNLNSYPGTSELFEFFCVEPSFFDREKGHFAYEVSVSSEGVLIFSFSVVEGWVQTVLKFKNNVVTKFLSEGISEVWISTGTDNTLCAQGNFNGSTVALRLRVYPELCIDWSILED